MIGFVTWPPFCTIIFYKGGQVTKPIIVVKIPDIVYHLSKRIFLALYLISKILVAYNYSYNAASDWPRTFSTARLFLFTIIITSNDDPKPSTVILDQSPSG